MRTGVKFKTGMHSGCLMIALVGIFVGCDGEGESSREAIVTGNSMAPAFWGQHVRVACDQCGYSFQVAGQRENLPKQLVCPNCGDRSVDSTKAQSLPAQRVRVKPCRDTDGKLNVDRWDVVAVRASDDRPAMIKRVIGLPGESIKFVGGDVLANGELVHKPQHIARAMRIPVFDSRFSSSEVLRRFATQASEGDSKNWSVQDGVWTYSPASDVKTSWLAYEQWRCVASGLPKGHVVSVEDWYEANVDVNRNLNEVNDIWARIELRAAEECQVEIAVNLGSERRVYEIDFGVGQVSFDGRSVSFKGDDPTATGGARDCDQPFQIEVCTFDRQLTMMVNGHSLPAVDLPSSDAVVHSLPVIQIGGRGTPLVMTRFRLWRDIHYFDDGVQNGPNDGNHLVAGSNEYLLLGDNVPVSIDSRHWPVPAVSGDEILGVIDYLK